VVTPAPAQPSHASQGSTGSYGCTSHDLALEHEPLAVADAEHAGRVVVEALLADVGPRTVAAGALAGVDVVERRNANDAELERWMSHSGRVATMVWVPGMVWLRSFRYVRSVFT
jgi:hypothetical protein